MVKSLSICCGAFRVGVVFWSLHQSDKCSERCSSAMLACVNSIIIFWKCSSFASGRPAFGATVRFLTYAEDRWNEGLLYAYHLLVLAMQTLSLAGSPSDIKQ